MAGGVIDRDLGWQAFKRNMLTIGPGVSIEVGIFDEDEAEKAFFHEFGTTHIPPRPFIRPAFDRNERLILKALERGLIQVTEGKRSIAQAADKIGSMIARLIKEEIDRLKTPPLEAATIADKDSSKLLVETGKMKRSITHRVKRGV